MNQDKTNLIKALKLYNASLFITVSTLQLALSVAYALLTGTSGLLASLLISGVLLLHLIGVSCFIAVMYFVKEERTWMICIYLLLPLGNYYCINDVTKRINERLQGLGLDCMSSYADIREIQKIIKTLNK